MKAIHKREENLIRSASYASVIVAVVLIVFKLFGWWVTNSVSLQASLIDSLLDAFASLVNMFAIYHALKPADAEHRFGHGKAESLAALGQSFCIGGSSIWLFYEAIGRFFTQEPIESTGVGLIVMVLAIVITLALVTFQQYVVKQTKSAAIAADMLHYRSDLLINMAVIVSLLSATYFQFYFIDEIFGLLIGIYILWSAWTIVLHAFNVLMDRELHDDERDKIQAIIHSHPEVVKISDLRTRTSGLHQFFQLNLYMKPDLSFVRASQVADEVEQEVIKAYPKCQVMIRMRPLPKSKKVK